MDNNTNTNNNQNNHSNIQMMVSYTKGLSESLKHICGKVGIQIPFRGATPSKAS